MFSCRSDNRFLLPLFLGSMIMTAVIAIQDDSRIIRMTNPFGSNADIDDDNHNHNLLSRSSSSSSSLSSTKKLFANSPILYLKLKSTANALLQQQQHRYPSSSSSSSTFINNKPLNEITSVRRKNSNIYKLPLKFVSNAKPVHILNGINESGNEHFPYSINRKKILASLGQKFHKPYSPSLSSSSTPSKIFYLPTKYLSNAKPIFIKTLKPIDDNDQRNTYYNYLF
ncbi:uncharacterized protein LOC142597791 [Dermatophagoides farinae]|uniref:uncharacterized protein LOC142597791 n=1 Tax=Dermatophagoides farinae TaxID=6954 RepID=UPI003F6037FA